MVEWETQKTSVGVLGKIVKVSPGTICWLVVLGVLKGGGQYTIIFKMILTQASIRLI